MSRPEKPIDWSRVDKLLEAGCLGTEIAANFDMHPHTFYDRVYNKYNMTFTDYMSDKRCKGDSLLREVQYDKALKKDNTQLIWLGKNRLGQRDHEEKVTTAPNDAHLSTLLDALNLTKALQIENQELKAKLNDFISKADPVLPGSEQAL